MSGSNLTGLFQALFLFTMIADVTSAVLSYFLVRRLTTRIVKHKIVITFIFWTVFFYGFIALISVFPYLMNVSLLPVFPSLSIQVMQFIFLFFPCNFVFIGTWLLGALLMTYKPPKGYA
jgi:hypothetical protein